jgi:hypothetical protein
MTEFSEDVLERTLSHRLHEELSGMTASPTLAATVRRRHTRRAWGVRLAAAAPVVAALAVAGAFVLRPATAPTEAPNLGDVTYVSSRTSAALESASDYVRVEHTAYSDGSSVSRWADLSNESYRIEEGAQVTVFKGESPNNGLTVDSANHTYTRDSMGILRPAPDQPNDGMFRGDFLSPDDLRAATAAGQLTLVGPEPLGGADTVHLRWLQVAGLTMDLWVDATTFLPLKINTVGGKGSSATDIEWLPRSPENLAKFDLAIPPGYTERAPEDPRHP